jgi:hypothetical protein
MKRLWRHFAAASTDDLERTFGVEVETLFVDKNANSVIGMAQSQRIFVRLLHSGWQPQVMINNHYLELAKQGYRLKYDVAANLLEVVSPPALVAEWEGLFRVLRDCLGEIYMAAGDAGAQKLETHFIDSPDVELVRDSVHNRLDWQLNGTSIRQLGLIASVHFNVDLLSISEGFGWMNALNRQYKFEGWPPVEVVQNWSSFVAGSPARYEDDRYGPQPDALNYFIRLAAMRVYKNEIGGRVFLEAPPKEFKRCREVGIETFVASVWWWNRFRVRNGRLVLEIRAVPRSADDCLINDFRLIKSVLDI